MSRGLGGPYDDLVARIDVDRLVGRLVDLVRIPSVNPFGTEPGPTEGEARVAEYLGNHLCELGWQVGSAEAAPGRPNVWAHYPGAGPGGRGDGATLALAGHLDTVGVNGFDQPFSGAVESGRIHGRGSCDMKAALAAYLEVATVLTQAGVVLDGQLMIAGLVDEEYALTGSRWFGEHGPSADWAIIGEPTGLDICTAHLGQHALMITTHGRASHSSIPEKGVNAIDHMALVIEALGRYRAEILARPAHPLCGTGRISPGVISGGDIVAIVPDRCHLEIDRRLTPADTVESVVEDLRRHLDPLVEIDPDFRYELSEPTWDVGSLDTPVDSPVVEATVRAAERLGLPSQPVGFPAATDGPNLGIPTVICGPGALESAHTVTESVTIDEVVDATRLYLHATLDLVGVDPGADSPV